MTLDTFLSPTLLSRSIQIPSLKPQDLAFLSPLDPWQGQSGQLCSWPSWPPSPTSIKADTDADCRFRLWWTLMGLGFVGFAGLECDYLQGASFILSGNTCPRHYAQPSAKCWSLRGIQTHAIHFCLELYHGTWQFRITHRSAQTATCRDREVHGGYIKSILPWSEGHWGSAVRLKHEGWVEINSAKRAG